jgi:predicted ATPase/class 3 adenylate cyclase
MAELPSGVVTFLFSDIEGSTRLIEAAPDRYPAMLDRHRGIVREALARFGGHEVNTEGDSFFAVFAAADDAVLAAIEIQLAMAAEAWPADVVLRVRIGIHTGEGLVVEDDYVGLEVHRAARIMAAANGGQILISDTTRSLAARNLGEVELRDLGEHALRDLSGRERLFMVALPGVATDGRAPRTLGATPNNLPTQLSALVGREEDRAAVSAQLLTDGVRLVTLIGPGGIGKTRLALQVAADEVEAFPDGVYFVDLAAARDEAAALRAIVEAVGVSANTDDDLRLVLAQQLGGKRQLLVLDNFEQVVSAAPAVAELLRRCPELKALVTSREALRIQGERLFPLAPLSLAERGRALTAENALRGTAIRLFVERARAAQPSFALTDANAPVVADICARLDGLPLAIELAAPRLRLFSVEELRDRLNHRLETLRGGARDLPERQRTLRSTIEWGYELLDADEQALFAVLSVFPSATVSAVEKVAAGLDGVRDIDVVGCLASLVDKSMLRAIDDGQGQRLTMLEIIREYAAEQLGADPPRRTACRGAHATVYVQLAADMRPTLRGRQRTETLAELARELGNLKAAWAYLVELGDTAQLTVLLDPLWSMYEARGWYHGLYRLSNDLLGVISTASRDGSTLDDEVTLRLVVARSLMAVRGYTAEVEALYNQALELVEASGGPPPKRLPVLRSLASFHLYRGELEKTIAIGRKLLVIADEAQDESVAVEGHLLVGPNVAFMGNAREGFEHLEQAIALFDPKRDGLTKLRLGPNPGVAATAVLALLRWLFGYPATADRLAARVIELGHELGHPYSLAYGIFHVAVLDLWSERWEAADGHAAAVLAIAQENDYHVWRAVALAVRGVTESILREPEVGLQTTEQGIALYEDLRTPPIFWPLVLGLHGQALVLAGKYDLSLETMQRAIALAAGQGPTQVGLDFVKADAQRGLGDLAGAEATLWAALEASRQFDLRMIALQAARRLVQLPAVERDPYSVLRDVLDSFDEGQDTPLLVDAARLLATPARL